MITDTSTTPFQDLEKNGVIVLPWINGMREGVGYDSLTQVVKGDASGDGSDLTLTAVTQAQTFTQQIRRIENTEQLNHSLAVSASVSGGYAAFSASASASYLTESQVNAYSLFFLINTVVRNSEKMVKRFVLDRETLGLPADEFRSKFGDYFVQGIVAGGTFYSLLQLETDSEQTKEDISVSVEAKYDAGFSIGAKFSTDIKNAASHKGVQFSAQNDAHGATPKWNASTKLDTPEDILAAAQDFPAAVAEAGGDPMFAILMPYALLKDAPQSNSSIDLGALNAVRQSLLDIYLQAKQVLDSVNYALDHPRQFSSDALANLGKVRNDLLVTMQQIDAAKDQLRSDPKALIKLPPPVDLSLIPQRLWGGTLTVIAPPSGVVPVTLRFKLGVARTEAWSLANADLKEKVAAYLDKIERDVTINLGNALDFITTLQSSVSALDNAIEYDAAVSIVSNLANARDTSAAAWGAAIEEQRAQYDTLAVLETAHELDFLEKNLHPVVWGDTDDQYGGSAFWRELQKTTDGLTTIANAWGRPRGSGVDYYSFKSGLWEQLRQEFHVAAVTLYNAG